MNYKVLSLDNEVLYVLEHEEVYRGYHLVIVFSGWGHRCGYIGTPYEQEFTSVQALNNYVEVHGGFSYADKNLHLYTSLKGEDIQFYYGFDCGHYYDSLDYESMDKYGFAKKQYDYAEYKGKDGKVRSIEFVLRECRKAVDQFILIRKYAENTSL